MTKQEGDILAAIIRRKLDYQSACDPCSGTGRAYGRMCVECLGQGVILTAAEYRALLKMLPDSNGDALHAQVITEIH